MKTRPWTRIDSHWWPDIVEDICGEWSESSALMDLRWHADRLQQKRIKRIPGRAFFAARWEWSDWRTRQLMRNEAEWMTHSPAHLQPASSPPPDIRLINQGETRGASSSPPARLQENSTGAELHNSQFTRSQLRREKREGLVQAFPPPSLSPSGWDSDLVLSCWRAAWPKAGRGPAPEPSDRSKDRWLGRIASSLGDITPEDFISALACWLEVQATGRGKVFPARGELPALGHVASVYRKYLPGSSSRPRTASEREQERERQRLEDQAWDLMTPDEQLAAF